MSQIHLCNTFFEKELEPSQSLSLFQWLHVYPTILQLQFLPLLYADPEDVILVSELPDSPDPRLCLLKTPPNRGTLDSWAPSLVLGNWAKEHSFSYKMPPWEVVQKINSKLFSFSESPLPGSALLSTEKEAVDWIAKTSGPKVLKTLFGTAGSGHFHVGKNPSRFLQSQFSKKLPILGEPWVERLLDFSTQWHLGNSPQFLGATIFQNEANGTYLGTFVGKSFAPFEWALEEHLSFAKPLLKKVADLGFFGYLGIDAYVYCFQGKERLQPVVEINGRKTMSWLALEVQKKKYLDTPLFLSYARSKNGLLPNHLNSIHFTRNLSLKISVR